MVRATEFHEPGSGASDDGDGPGDEAINPVFDRTVEEGERRLTRTWPGTLVLLWIK